MLIAFLALLAFNIWFAFGMWTAQRLEPKVGRLALLVVGSALLWPWTLRSHRRASRSRVEFGEAVVVD